MMKRRSTLVLMSRASLAGLAGLALGGCGFKLRGDQHYSFQTIAVMPHPGSAIAIQLRRSFGDAVRVLKPEAPLTQAQVVIDILQELREKIVVGINSSGQVREFQLRIRVKFRVRTSQGLELTPETEILQQRDISFNESAVLAKEAEEALLYRDMQNDIVQQLMRRLALIKL
jgi:LPS-assembly lipoprotein